MNLAKKYKQLFEGKVRSNDSKLLNENDAETYLPIVQADAKLKQLGMTNVEITSDKQLKMTFNKYLDDITVFDKIIPDEVRSAGVGMDFDFDKDIHNVFIQFNANDSEANYDRSSSTGARNLETDEEFYDVVATIYSGAGDDNTNMTDDITDELGDYYDDIYNNPNNEKLIDAYDDLRSTIDGTNDEQYEAAKALLDLLR